MGMASTEAKDHTSLKEVVVVLRAGRFVKSIDEAVQGADDAFAAARSSGHHKAGVRQLDNKGN